MPDTKQSGKKVIHCPECERAIEFGHFREIQYFPFCSHRCKLIDLGRWFNEEYAIERDIDPFTEEVEEDR